MSRVTCHVSHVPCHMSCLTCFVFYKVLKLVGGSVINTAKPVYFFFIKNFLIMIYYCGLISFGRRTRSCFASSSNSPNMMHQNLLKKLQNILSSSLGFSSGKCCIHLLKWLLVKSNAVQISLNQPLGQFCL